MKTVRNTSHSRFNADVLTATRPVLVDFYADWCGPCRAIAPVVDAIATANENHFDVAKVNVDENAELATRYGVESIPTLMLFHEGEPVQRWIGAIPREEIEQAARNLSQAIAVPH